MGKPRKEVVRRWERVGYMTPAVIAFFTGHSVQTVYSWIRRGKLRHVVYDGGSVFVLAKEARKLAGGAL
jgi:predicted site-specific integrase-resolvase